MSRKTSTSQILPNSSSSSEGIPGMLGVVPLLRIYGVEFYTRPMMVEALPNLTDVQRVALNMSRVSDANVMTPIVGPRCGTFAREAKTGRITQAKIGNRTIPLNIIKVGDQARRSNASMVLILGKESFLLVPTLVEQRGDSYLFSTGVTKKTMIIKSLATSINSVVLSLLENKESTAAQVQKAFTQEMSLRKLDLKNTLGTWRRDFTTHLREFIVATDANGRRVAEGKIVGMSNPSLSSAFYTLKDLISLSFSLAERAEELKGQNSSGAWTGAIRLNPVIPLDEKSFEKFSPNNEIKTTLVAVSELQLGDLILAQKGPKLGLKKLKEIINNDQKVVKLVEHTDEKLVELKVGGKKRQRGGKTPDVNKFYQVYPADALRVSYEIFGKKSDKKEEEKEEGAEEVVFEPINEDLFF